MAQKGFAQVLVLLLLLITIPIGIYLVQHPAIFKPKAAEVERELAQPATLEDYWQGKAKWQLIRKYTLANLEGTHGDGYFIKVQGDSWYLFHRKVEAGPAEKCIGSQGSRLSTYIRKSTDHGLTWSDPVDVVVAQDGTPWECAATDGDVYYNDLENRWHYLFQCLGADGIWNGCELTRDGPDPMGLFQQTHANPVIKGGDFRQPWDQICTDSTKDCFKIAQGNKVFDAGTFDIFKYDGEYYFVSFHGFDGVHGFRGIAKTKNFINWIAGDPTQGVPADDVLDKFDAQKWRESWNSGGPIGFGAGSILQDGDFYYLLSEGADINLACTASQNWDLGIFRSKSLTNTKWEQYPLGNPIFYSSKAKENNGGSCNIGYPRIFKDATSNEIYLTFSRNSSDWNYRGIYLFKLVKDTNFLKNGDLWRCDSQNWNKTNGKKSKTTLNVFRYPDKSSDSGCYLEASCNGSSCEGNQSFYQDIKIGKLSSKQFAFGGKFATEQGVGNAHLTLWQMDAKNKVILKDSIDLSLGTTYQAVKKDFVVNPKTKVIRYQLDFGSPTTIKADEMFISSVNNILAPLLDPDATIAPSENPSVSSTSSPTTQPVGNSGCTSDSQCPSGQLCQTICTQSYPPVCKGVCVSQFSSPPAPVGTPAAVEGGLPTTNQ